MDYRKIEEIYDNWANGNIREARTQMKSKSKKFLLEFIYYLNELGIDYEDALKVAKDICED